MKENEARSLVPHTTISGSVRTYITSGDVMMTGFLPQSLMTLVKAGAVSLASIVFAGCTSGQVDPFERQEPGGDFFPTLRAGETVVWAYAEEWIEVTPMERAEGTMTWDLVQVEKSGADTVSTLRQVFSGIVLTVRSGSPGFDTTEIAADTCTAVVRQDPAARITLTTADTSRRRGYGERAVSFPRYSASAGVDTLLIAGEFEPSTGGYTIRSKRGLGMVYYHVWTGSTVRGHSVILKRR